MQWFLWGKFASSLRFLLSSHIFSLTGYVKVFCKKWIGVVDKNRLQATILDKVFANFFTFKHSFLSLKVKRNQVIITEKGIYFSRFDLSKLRIQENLPNN